MTTSSKEVDAANAKCEARIDHHLQSRLSELRRLWQGYCDGDEDLIEEFYDFGLSFDYVTPTTFADQAEGYWRYQLSWGGPSDEFRFFASHWSDPPYRIEYRFMDWFDGAVRELTAETEDGALLRAIWENFQEGGSTEATFDKARE